MGGATKIGALGAPRFMARRDLVGPVWGAALVGFARRAVGGPLGEWPEVWGEWLQNGRSDSSGAMLVNADLGGPAPPRIDFATNQCPWGRVLFNTEPTTVVHDGHHGLPPWGVVQNDGRLRWHMMVHCNGPCNGP